MKHTTAILSGIIAAAIILASSIYAPGMSPPVYTDKIIGPDSATDNAIVRFDGVTGKLAQDSPYSTISDTGVASFDTTIRIADSSTFSVLNDGSSLFEIILATGVGGVAKITGDATDKDTLFFAEPYDATGKASVIVGLGGIGAITLEADIGGSSSKLENTVNGPFIISNLSSLIRLESNTDIQFDLPDAAGATTAAVRDSNDAEVFTVDSDGTLTNVGGRIIGRTTVADANHTAANGEYLIAYTSLTVTRTVALPTAVGRTGQIFLVKDESGAAAAGVKITIDPDGIETIDGALTLDIVTAHGAIEAYSSGAAWFTK